MCKKKNRLYSPCYLYNFVCRDACRTCGSSPTCTFSRHKPESATVLWIVFEARRRLPSSSVNLLVHLRRSGKRCFSLLLRRPPPGTPRGAKGWSTSIFYFVHIFIFIFSPWLAGIIEEARSSPATCHVSSRRLAASALYLLSMTITSRTHTFIHVSLMLRSRAMMTR